MPSPVHIDTEISTNCILRIGDGVSRTFAFTLDFDATPSNNVQITFGHDADTDGVLSIEETGMTIGWDCGTWFVNGAAEEADGLSETPTVRDGRKAIRFELLLQADGSPRRLTIRDGENDLFQALSASLPAGIKKVRPFCIMRWLNRDPLEESGGCNLCAFCNNSPLYIIDPLGDIAVTDIPGIMDNKKWSVGAALMRCWLSLDSRATTIPNETIVKMNWVLGFDRAKTVCDKIFYEKQYVNQATRKEIIAMIKRTLRGAEGSFCLLNRPASQVEADYVNTRPVGNIFDPLDDMLAALGRVNLRMAVSGYVKGKCAFVTSVGVYVRDSYDFVDEQSLGYWNSRTNYAGRNFRKGDKVSNASFRDYAKKTGKGADFLIYSDIKITTLEKAEKVVLSP